MAGYLKSIKLFLICSNLFAAGTTNAPSKPFITMANKMAKTFNAPTIDAKTLITKKRTSPHVIFDAREKDEYKVSHIKGAINVGYRNFDIKESVKSIDKSTTIIVYCSVGYRSGEVAQMLIKSGHKAYNLYGGIFNWVNQGYPLYDQEKKSTVKIHGFNPSWSKWLSRGSIVYD